MEEVSQSIRKILPAISDETLNSLLQLFQELGVNEVAHLELVTEEDLYPVLKRIQARLLIREWNKNCKDVNGQGSIEVNPGKTSTSTIQVEIIPAVGTSSSIVDKIVLNSVFNPQTFIIPWDSMPADLTRCLRNEERPKPSLRNHMVRIIADAINKVEAKPGRKALNVVAERIVQKYPKSFTDEISKEMSGELHLSLRKQLEVRFDNLNRSNLINTLKRSSKNENVGNPKKIKASDSYGCVNFQPNLPAEETTQTQKEKQEKMKLLNEPGVISLNKEMRNLLLATYFSIRKEINSGQNIQYLIEEWPLLLSKEGLLDHFFELVNVNIEEKLSASISKRGFSIISYFLNEPKIKSTSREKFKETVLNLKSNSQENDDMYTWEVLISLLMVYFGEDVNELFVNVDIASTVNEVERIIPNTPCIICYGDQLQDVTAYMLGIDSKVVIHTIKDFKDALGLLFASFFCFNIEYPSKSATTLEFIQRCFLDINPAKGSKADGSKKRREIIDPKIISLKKKITDYEWNL